MCTVIKENIILLRPVFVLCSSCPLAICFTHSSVYVPAPLPIHATFSSQMTQRRGRGWEAHKAEDLCIQNMKIMASGPITSREIDGETVETVSDFIFLGSKITADGNCSHEIKRRLLPGRKVMTNLDSIFKSRDITLPTKVCLVKAMVFLVIMYGCES